MWGGNLFEIGGGGRRKYVIKEGFKGGGGATAFKGDGILRGGGGLG